MTIADPPKEEPVSANETTAFATDGAWGGWGAEAPEEEKAAADEPTADAADGDWGAWGAEAPEEAKAAADEPTADTSDGAWGAEAPDEEKAATDEPAADPADGAWGTSGEPVAEEKATASNDNEIRPETAMEELHLTDINNEQSTEAAEGDWSSGGW